MMLKESRIASSEYSPSNPRKSSIHAGSAHITLPKNRARQKATRPRLTTASSPTRSATRLVAGAAGERTIQSLSWQRLQLVISGGMRVTSACRCHLCLQELE